MTLSQKSRDCLLLLACLTAFNLIWDYFFNRLGPFTAAWQGGMMSGLLWSWLFTRRPF